VNLVSLHGVVLVVAVVWLVELPCCTYGTVQLFTERNGRHCRLDRISKLSKYRKNLESLAASKSQQPRTGRISNVAREEFAKELEKRIGLDQTGYQSLREAVITMLDTKKIDSFCEAVSKYLLGGLAGRDVKGGEDPFAQGKKTKFVPVF